MDSTIGSDLIVAASALAWPILIGVLLIVYRKKIGRFVKDITPRIGSFTVGPVSIQLAQTTGFEPKWTAGVLDYRQTGISIGPSHPPELLSQMHGPRVDYAIFDLGEGKQWISSRLYIFVVLLHIMRGLRSILFVNKSQGIRHHFVGIADPTQVRYALAMRYPWLEDAFAMSYSLLPTLKINSINGIINQPELLMTNFLENIGIKRPQPPLPGQEREWFKLEKEQAWEHAELLDTGKVQEILEGVIYTSWMSESELRKISNDDQMKLILSYETPFVAILDEDRSFKKLIDRLKLADEVAHQI